MRDVQHYTETQTKLKEQLVVRNDMDVNQHETLFNIYTQVHTKLKEQNVVRKYMDVNEHNITLRHKLR